MTAQLESNRRRGEPLLALALIVVGWAGARMALWHSPFQPTFAATAPTSAWQPQRRPNQASEVRSESLPVIGSRARRMPAAPSKRLAVGPVTAVPPKLEGWGGFALQARPPGMPAGLFPALTASATPVDHPVVQPVVALPEKARRRWHLGGWIAWRSGSGVPRRADGPRPVSYGGTQAGAVARLDLASGAHRPAVQLRTTYAPDRFRQADIAAGLGLRPLTGVPVRIIGEVRATHTQGQTEVRPGLIAVTEFSPIALPLRLTAEGYGQAGWVGGRYSTAFVDGQAKVTRRILSSGPATISVGAGAWGGAQKFAKRLDIGPTIGLDIDAGPAVARLAFDYRVRVSGNATPGSGAAITLSTGF